MKTTFKYCFVLFFSTIFFFLSCKKDGDIVTATAGTSGTLVVNNSTLVLSKTNANDTVVKFNWELADFGYSAGITQTLQFAVSGTNFADSVVVSLDPTQTSLSYIGSAFNAVLAKLNLPFDQSSNVDVRVKSSISSTVAGSYSNTITMTVTPYAMTSWLYVLGEFQNWVVESPDSIVSQTGNNVYVGIINFPKASSPFKLTPEKNWNLSYGDGGNGKLSTSGGDIPSAGAGSYQITANLNTLTIDMNAFQYSVIGSATPGGWSTDTDLTYNNGDSTWSGVMKMVDGAFKFRKNHNYVSTTDYGAGSSSGIISLNGGDISFTGSGNYKVVLDIPHLKYTITAQ